MKSKKTYFVRMKMKSKIIGTKMKKTLNYMDKKYV